jgi:four helix bundle protein
MRDIDLNERILEYAASVFRVMQKLPDTALARNLGNQLMRSGTSVGANYEEARAAESRADFIHKLQVALKESRETLYWLRLIEKSGLLSVGEMSEILNESVQIRSILSKCVVTAKSRE